MKICRVCKEEKGLDQYHKDKRNKDGHVNKCKECFKKDYHKHDGSLSKECSVCHEEKSLDDFYKGMGKFGRTPECKLCKTNDNKVRGGLYYSKNKDVIRSRNQKFYAENTELIKSRHMKYMYEITLEQYNKMLEEQNYVCAICKGVNANGKRLSIDHDHSCCPGEKSCGECIRSLLCNNCNSGLGYFCDSEERLSEALRYIRQHRR